MRARSTVTAESHLYCNMFNNAPLVLALANDLEPSPSPESRRCITSEPCLPERLPSTRFIQREAEDGAPRAIIRQLRRSPTPPVHTSEDEFPDRPRRASTSSASSSSSPVTAMAQSLSNKRVQSNSSWKEPQPFEIFRAVEKKDIMYLMEIRDRAFPLLLRKTGDATPLLHAMRIGQSHRDVAIVLLGAFSRSPYQPQARDRLWSGKISKRPYCFFSANSDYE